jgi:hypothetical protein
VTGCLAKRTTVQEVKKEKITVVSWSSTEYDDGDCWKEANPTRLTVPEGAGGLYVIQWSVDILPSSLSGEKELWIRLNGDDNKRLGAQDYVGPADVQTITVIARLAASDYVECCIYLETASNGETSKDEYGSGDDLNRVKFELVR